MNADPVRAVAEALREHDPDRVGLCEDHEALCCPAGDAHNFRDGYQHQAEAAMSAMLAVLDRLAPAPVVDDPDGDHRRIFGEAAEGRPVLLPRGVVVRSARALRDAAELAREDGDQWSAARYSALAGALDGRKS